jgi:hypothetical protein
VESNKQYIPGSINVDDQEEVYTDADLEFVRWSTIADLKDAISHTIAHLKHVRSDTSADLKLLRFYNIISSLP